MTLTKEATELVVPEIPTTLTVYDRMKQNREKLYEAITNGSVEQAFGSWKNNGAFCFLQTALNIAAEG